MDTLDTPTIEKSLQELPGWSAQNDRLCKQFCFGSFREAISFIVRVGFEAEAIDHHPEILNVYNKVDIALTSHDAGNKITQRDVSLAQAIERFSWV